MIWFARLSECILWVGSSDSPVNRCVEFVWTSAWVSVPF
jgi:hypothetical protein